MIYCLDDDDDIQHVDDANSSSIFGASNDVDATMLEDDVIMSTGGVNDEVAQN